MADRSSLHVELNTKRELYELHTHLLGMGNSDFWVLHVLTDQTILPTNDQFRDDRDPGRDLRRKLGPLVWCEDRFVDRKRTADFFDHLRLHPDEIFDDGVQDDETNTLKKLDTPELRHEMEHRNLSFENNFSYDVVINIDDLTKAFSLSDLNRDIVQTILEEKLGVYKEGIYHISPFKYWIIFNARKQKIEIVYGMTVEKLRELIGGHVEDKDIRNQAVRDARAHIRNAFSMLNADGTKPRSIDFHSFRGQFTPEFYPRRFALKDSLYGQRLDALALLLQHVLFRYQSSTPCVKYCEFSVGVGDLSRPHIFDILRSFPSLDDRNFQDTKTAFQSIVEDFPWLTSDKNTVTYRFLAGFDRQRVIMDTDTVNDENLKPIEQKKAIQLLVEAPQLAIYYMLNEIIRSGGNDETKLFILFTKDLTNFEEKTKNITPFYDWVVGLDLFGDELGFPYCPFVAKEFLKHVETRRIYNPHYGLRIHGGENVVAVNSASPSYHLFVSHMYIVLLAIEYLKQKFKFGIRVGHGIAFNIIFDYKEQETSSNRKSSVLMAEMKELSRRILQNIPLEVNITSNVYLLGESVRRAGPGERTHSLKSIFDAGVPVVLSTDDDGIWPIDECPLGHAEHNSLAAEYCRAINSHIIQTSNQLNNIINDSKRYCFDRYLSTSSEDATTDAIETNDRFRIPLVVLHPKLVRYMLNSEYKVSTPFSKSMVFMTNSYIVN